MRSLVDRSTSETGTLVENLNTGLADVYVLGLPSTRSKVTLNNTMPLISSWNRTTEVRQATAGIHIDNLIKIDNPYY